MSDEIDRGLPLILYCPNCGNQHIDEVDEVNNPGWDNPPHTSHKCLFCACIWRPADTPTEGVRSIRTVGKSDSWVAIGKSAPAINE